MKDNKENKKVKDEENHQQQQNTNQQNEETKTSEQKQESSKKQEKDLQKEILKQEQIIENLKLKVLNLEIDLRKKDQEFVSSLEQKAAQAQTILTQKTQELESKFDQKLNDALFKIFSQKTNTLLETINHFNKIVEKDYDDPKIQAFIYGFKMFSQNMIDGLGELKITKITPQIGSVLNDDEMEVFEVIEQENVKSMTILEVVNDGFKFEDKVIKFASVKVAK